MLPPRPAYDPPAFSFYGGAVTSATLFSPAYHSGWQHESTYGSGGYTSAGAPPTATSPTSPPDLANNGSDPATFDPHPVTAQVAQQGKPVCDNVLEPGVVSGVHEGEWWVADTGAMYHVTGDPSCIFEHKLPL